VNRTLADRPPRTLLEHRIRQRRMTFEEFVQHAEAFAHDNDEPGTLSLRHLQRLASGQPIGALRPATARLLEHLFGEPITALLAPPKNTVANENEDSGTELRQLLDTARRLDGSTIEVLHRQLDAIRRLDRQLGAIVVRDEVKTKIQQVERLAAYSLDPGAREPLAALLSEMYTLAGWQALDLGDITDSWQHYEKARAVAAQSDSIAYESHAAAEQAFVLIDAGATRDAVDILDHARHRAGPPRIAPCGHGWPPHTAKPSLPTVPRPPACMPSIALPTCSPPASGPTTDPTSLSIQCTSPAGAAMPWPASATPMQSQSLPTPSSISTRPSSAQKPHSASTSRWF
jgi:hypothetical protein